MGWLIAAWLLLLVVAVVFAALAYAGFERERTERRPGYIIDDPRERSA